jgi:Uma2 family endonuclease
MATAAGVVIPATEDGFPLVDMSIVGKVLERYPDLRMSFDEFLALDDGFHGEWIDGRVEIRGSQHLLHHDALTVLSIAFRFFQEKDEPRAGEGLRFFLMRPGPDLPARIVDFFFLTAGHADRLKHCYVDGPADIVIEVVDDESRHRDTVEKFREYERGGVREYWIIDPFERKAQVYRLRDGRYEPMPAGDPSTLRSEVLPGLWIDPEWIWNDWSGFDIARKWGLMPPRRAGAGTTPATHE